MAADAWRTPALRRVDVPLANLPPDPRDPLSSARVEGFYVEHLDEHENLLGLLDGVSGGSVEANANRTKRRSGSIRLDQPADVAWAKHRIRIWRTMTALGQSFEAPLGTFIISSPEQQFWDGGVSRELELIDKMHFLEEQAVTETYSVEPGQNVVDTVISLVTSTGETRISATESDATVANARQWEPGTTLLRVANDLLASINYWALHTDGVGAYQIQPYQDPRQRPIAYRFHEGAESIHLPSWSRSQDLFDVKNRARLFSREDDDGNVLSAVAVNDNPDSPTSYQARGNMWFDLIETGVDTDSQATLDSLAERRLLDNSSPPTAVSLSHAWLPDLELNDAVQLRSQGYEGLCTVTKMSMNLDPGSLVSAEWREVPVI